MPHKNTACEPERPVFMSKNGILYLVATPIGNLSDITYRAVETLRGVDLIAAEDTRRTAALLNHLEIKKPVTSYFEHNASEKGEYLISRLLGGESVALVSDAGTPAISDPGEDIVRQCIENDIRVVPIPGATAAISALICSGLPTAHFSFEGFLTVNKKRRKEHLEQVKNSPYTLIFYEAPHKLRKTLADMQDILGDRKIVLARELTKIHEEIKRTTISKAAEFYTENTPRGEFVLIVEGILEESEISADCFLNNLPVNEHINYYISAGQDKKEALKSVAKDRGVSKRDIYNTQIDGKG